MTNTPEATGSKLTIDQRLLGAAQAFDGIVLEAIQGIQSGEINPASQEYLVTVLGDFTLKMASNQQDILDARPLPTESDPIYAEVVISAKDLMAGILDTRELSPKVGDTPEITIDTDTHININGFSLNLSQEEVALFNLLIQYGPISKKDAKNVVPDLTTKMINTIFGYVYRFNYFLEKNNRGLISVGKGVEKTFSFDESLVIADLRAKSNSPSSGVKPSLTGSVTSPEEEANKPAKIYSKRKTKPISIIPEEQPVEKKATRSLPPESIDKRLERAYSERVKKGNFRTRSIRECTGFLELRFKDDKSASSVLDKLNPAARETAEYILNGGVIPASNERDIKMALKSLAGKEELTGEVLKRYQEFNLLIVGQDVGDKERDLILNPSPYVKS